ncbi:hypothetical protein CES85_3183 (plasmid) [Ochrobactrum quorumnocens]|uniref:Uncharacterized protein n=1 Tax=Ochrobactrum quorumnocens TaxID=271865 RepID=A0A248UMW5_9HYPH|nr:hypothetical protein CES85_3183 [[Ochrobactrum] quorumnocens]
MSSEKALVASTGAYFRRTGAVCRTNGAMVTMNVLRFFMTYPGMAVVR